jgi:hypothetical protein
MRERGPAILMWLVVAAAFGVALEAHGIPRAVAAFVLVWWILAMGVLAWTSEDPMMVAEGEPDIRHVPAKLCGTPLASALVVGPLAWLLLSM